ncbi:gluconate 2-dehydrogenase subunit 3 family protein [Stakelama tenebrarum]|uniref:Gluconate 2-dehydrogenase subunit 3 family protein n=1 Tax=Stakelama tenebrarum TaxID=2711215 RepID=A0A6G6Y5N9_9SPHN|nr:gluconate 2-dehydrogenase subunit 3 family protein [Sphingosinithalassobacter tenebrarum]QIG80235.1 gluconate 2-dehydrogenase subunit 3 family protein [Sphingosinithalassobacter tenebrarum]
MADRFPDYHVLAKRDTASWNAQTGAVVDARLAKDPPEGVLSDRQRQTLARVIDRIVPQPEHRPPVNTLALVMGKIAANGSDGFRHHQLPETRRAWERGLDAVDAEACVRHGSGFAFLSDDQADAVLCAVEKGEVEAPEWQDLPAGLFWSWRLIPDIVSAYYAHPSAWSAMGFGGPASPRGYVRLQANRRDPWEAAERDDQAPSPAEARNHHAE